MKWHCLLFVLICITSFPYTHTLIKKWWRRQVSYNCYATLNLFISKSVWILQVNKWSTVKPWDFAWERLGIVLLPHLTLLEESTLFLVINWTYWVFLKFRESKFALNHLFDISKPLRIFILQYIGSGCVNNILVLSANNKDVDLLLIILGKSLSYNRNAVVPRRNLVARRV